MDKVRSSGIGARAAQLNRYASRMPRWFIPVLFLASVAHAKDDTFRSEWHASCEIGGTPVDIHFKSHSGDPTEDDMVVTLQWGSSRPAVLGVKPALFETVEFTTDAMNLCKEIGAFELPSGRLLFLFPRNDRPSEDQISAVVIDPKTRALVQTVGDLGAQLGNVYLLKEPGGFRIMLLRNRYQDANSHGEFGAPDWLLIKESGGHVVATWEVTRK